MSTKKQELKNRIEDLRTELNKFENELEELTELDIKKGDIVRIISTSPIPFTTDSPFVIGAYCKVISIAGYSNRITIELPKNVYHDTNVCKESQVAIVWSS